MIHINRIYMENRRSRHAFWEAWVVYDRDSGKCFNALRFGSLNGFGKLTCNPITTSANAYALERKMRKDAAGKRERDYELVHDQHFEVDSISSFEKACEGPHGNLLGIQLFQHLSKNVGGNISQSKFDPHEGEEVEPVVVEPVQRSESWGSW